MDQMETWEMILAGLLAAAVVLWMGPGLKHVFKNTPKGSSRDWLGLIGILGLVILFVFFLFALV